MSEFEPVLFEGKSYLPTEHPYPAEIIESYGYGDVFMCRADDVGGNEVKILWEMLDTYTPDQPWDNGADWDHPIAVLR